MWEGCEVERRHPSSAGLKAEAAESEETARQILTTEYVEYSTLHGINDLVRAERLALLAPCQGREQGTWRR